MFSPFIDRSCCLFVNGSYSANGRDDATPSQTSLSIKLWQSLAVGAARESLAPLQSARNELDCECDG